MTKRKRGKKIDLDIARRVQLKLKAACIGSTPHKVFSKFDKDKTGELDGDEFRMMVRKSMRVPKSLLSDNDINELVKEIKDQKKPESENKTHGRVKILLIG